MDDNSQIKAQKATQYLIDSAAEIAASKADLVRCENMLRVTKALAMRHSDEKSAAAQERDAYTSEQYQDAVKELAKVAGDFEKLRALREAAKMQIEYWRSLNANQRAAERGYGSAA